MPVTTATSATLQALIKAAQPGDEIKLPGGSVAGFAIKAVTKAAPGITIIGAPDTVLGWLAVNNSAGIALRGLGVALSGAAGSSVIGVNSSERIVLDGLTVTGNPSAKTPGDNGMYGIALRNCKDVAVKGCEVSQVAYGIQHMDCEGVEIVDNHVHHFRTDGIRGGGTSRLTITGNRVHDAYPLAMDHSDAIQVWTSNTTKPTADVLVEGNDLRMGGGKAFQAILIGNEANIPYERVVVRRNAIAGTIWNAISVSGAKDALIEDNYVLGFEGVTDAAGKAVTPWIMLRESTSGTVRNNTATKFDNYKSTGIIEAGNVTIPLAKPGDYSRLDAWLKGPDPKPATIEDRVAILEAEVAALKAAR